MARRRRAAATALLRIVVQLKNCSGHAVAAGRSRCVSEVRTGLGLAPWLNSVGIGSAAVAAPISTSGVQPRTSAVLVNMAKTGCVWRYFQAETVVFPGLQDRVLPRCSVTGKELESRLMSSFRGEVLL